MEAYKSQTLYSSTALRAASFVLCHLERLCRLERFCHPSAFVIPIDFVIPIAFVIPSEARDLGSCTRQQRPGFLASLGVTSIGRFIRNDKDWNIRSASAAGDRSCCL